MKVTRSGFLHMEFEYDFSITTFDKAWRPDWRPYKRDDSDTCICIGHMNIDFDVPDDFNPIPKQVAALEVEKAEALAAYQKSVASINERLGKLLAITTEVEA